MILKDGCSENQPLVKVCGDENNGAMYIRRTTKKKDGTNYDCRLLLIFDEESSRFSAILPEMLNFFIFFR